MSKIKTILQLSKSPRKWIIPLAEKGFFRWMDDERYIKMLSKCVTGKEVNLNDPKTFTEKIQWLKLHDRQERYIGLVDKILVKEYVGKLIGKEYIIPTLGVWETIESIQLDLLPSKFVLKCNHDSGSVVICRNKESFDFVAAKQKLAKCLKKDAYSWGREWPYKHVNRKVFAEELLEYSIDSKKDLVDYKMYCFGGKPKYCQVISERNTSEKIDFYDLEWNHQPFIGLTSIGLENNIKNSDKDIPKPNSLAKMIEISEILSKGIAFCRVDFYDIQGKLYFGEITLYPNAGFGEFLPSEWNRRLGELIEL